MNRPAKLPLHRDPLFRRLAAMVFQHKRLLALGMVAMAMAAATEPLMARLTGLLLDQGFYQKDARAGIWVPIAFVGLFVARGVANFASTFFLGRVSQAVLVDLRAQMFERLLHWPQVAFETTPSGVIITKFVNEASNALTLAAESMTTAVRDSLTVVGLLVVLLYYNWQLTLVTLMIAPVIVAILRTSSVRLRKLNVDNQEMLAEMTRAVQEAHEGARIIKIYGGQSYERGRFDAINQRLRRFAIKMQVAQAASTPLTQIVAAIGLAVVIGVALWQARTTGLSGGDFITFLTAALLLLPPLRHLAALNGPLARMLAAADSVFAMIDSPEEAETGSREMGRARGAIEFRNVSFRYAGAATAAVQELDLEVEPGEMIALVGPSGAGKTTFVNLIPRFLQPTQGDILLDGVPTWELRLQSLRAQIALVSQDTVLFDDTIAANIAYGLPDASRERIRAAAEAAYLLPFIESLPQGFDTRVGERSVKLSGGQRQRLSIARALLKDAPILLLDEATSALDSESERYIQASLDKLMQGRTTFVVAHRLSTIERADRIVVMEHGRIVEVGQHRQLLGHGGLYAHLYRIQFAEEAA